MTHTVVRGHASTRRLTAAVLSLLGLAAALAGCSTAAAEDDACAGTEPAPALVLVVGVHQNIPAPGIPEAVACQLRATVAAEHRITVIGVDGTPQVEISETFDISDMNDDAREADITRAVNTVLVAVAAAAADSDGSDLLGAVALAADTTLAAGTPDAHVVVIDSGLSDTGLDMTEPGMLAAAPQEVADFLAGQRMLPDLSGLSIELVGFGYAVAPQDPLTQPMRTANVEIWTAVLTRAGATSITVTPSPRTGAGPETTHTTRTVPIPDPVPWPDNPSEPAVYDDTTALGFQPDSTELRDPAAAAAVLQPLADWLAADLTRRAEITGTTSSAGTAQGRAKLSGQRAEAIKALLVQLGATADQITTHGAGYTANPPDRAPDGSLDPATAAQNRAVRITTTP